MLHFEGIAKFGVSKRINSTPAGVDQLIFGSVWLCYFCIFQVLQCPSVTMLFNLPFTDSGPIKSWHFYNTKEKVMLRVITISNVVLALKLSKE